MKRNTSKVFGSGQGKLNSLLGFVSFLFTKPGYAVAKRTLIRSLYKAGILTETKISYQDWIKNKLDPDTLKKDFHNCIPVLKNKPLISIIVAATDTHRLSETITSILSQLYPEWELLIVSNNNRILDNIPGNNRLQLITIDDTSLAVHYNTAIQKAKGHYTLFVQSGTQLTAHCLFEFAKHINTTPTNHIIYSDEDAINETGVLSDPYFKPNWSPDSFLSHNYIGDAFIIETKTAQCLQIRDGLNSSELYDLLLRASETTGSIGHISQVLFHFTEHAKHRTASIKVIADALARRLVPAAIESIAGIPGTHYIKYRVSASDKVSIIIPTKDQATLLKTAIDSVISKTSYPDYEILILNNNSITKEFFSLVSEYSIKYPNKFRCIDAGFPFNFSKLINIGVAASNGSYILMLNNDIEVIDSNWITDMVAYAQLKHIGAVGAKLLYPDNTIQHAGIVMGINGDSGHVFINMPKDTNGYHGNTKTTTNYSAVTGACLMCRKELYQQVGGMDETLAVEYNDLDLCLRFIKIEHYNVCIPVELYHHESASRGHPFRSKAAWLQHEKEFATFKSKWQPIIDNDPFYNHNLSLIATDFRLK